MPPPALETGAISPVRGEVRWWVFQCTHFTITRRSFPWKKGSFHFQSWGAAAPHTDHPQPTGTWEGARHSPCRVGATERSPPRAEVPVAVAPVPLTGPGTAGWPRDPSPAPAGLREPLAPACARHRTCCQGSPWPLPLVPCSGAGPGPHVPAAWGAGGGHSEGFPAPPKPPPATSQKVVRWIQPPPARPKGVTDGGKRGFGTGGGEPAAAFRGTPGPPAPSPRPQAGGGRRRRWGGKAPRKRCETFQAAAGAAPRDRHRLRRGGPAPGWGRGWPPTPAPLIKSHFGKLMPPPSPRPAALSPREGGGGAWGGRAAPTAAPPPLPPSRPAPAAAGLGPLWARGPARGARRGGERSGRAAARRGLAPPRLRSPPPPFTSRAKAPRPTLPLCPGGRLTTLRRSSRSPKASKTPLAPRTPYCGLRRSGRSPASSSPPPRPPCTLRTACRATRARGCRPGLAYLSSCFFFPPLSPLPPFPLLGWQIRVSSPAEGLGMCSGSVLRSCCPPVSEKILLFVGRKLWGLFYYFKTTKCSEGRWLLRGIPEYILQQRRQGCWGCSRREPAASYSTTTGTERT